MNRIRLLTVLLLASAAGLLGGCSAGNSGDSASTGVAIPMGLDRFLLFPNPIAQSATTFQTDTNAFAQAYYKAVDPGDARTTLAAWKLANGFDGAAAGDQYTAVFRDVRDLGYGRRMTGRINQSDGSIAFYVENYNVNVVPGGYSKVNVDAAVVRDGRWHVGTNAIEWSCDPQPKPCAKKFAKYYNFDPVTGQRQNMLDLDQRGMKAMPGICINCHGGRVDPLTPASTFGMAANTATQQRGDTLGKLQPFNVDSFEWSTAPGFTRADQENKLKIFNQWVLCSYPGTASYNWTTASPTSSCTQQGAPGTHEWQGTEAKSLMSAWYGGNINNPAAVFADLTAPPASWGGDAALYQQVIAPYCRTCHIVRGTGDESDIDFTTQTKFANYKDRIKAHVFDRGNMPLAFLVYQDFWRSTAPDTLAAFIDSVTLPGTATANGKAKRPGRPIADAGPDRMVKPGVAAALSAADSLFATTYNWSIVGSNPPGSIASAAIANPTAKATTFTAALDGVYQVQLVVGNGSQTDTASISITVDAASNFPDPATIKFAQALDVLRNNPHAGAKNCTLSGCHDTTVPPAPPIAYAQGVDRDGVGGPGTATDEIWLLADLRGRANLTEIAASPLLRKPTGSLHFGSNPTPPIDLTSGMAALASFSKLYWWIANGMPPGGVVARAAATITNPITFSGGTFGVPLSGSASIGATNYAWSVVPNTIPAHPNGTSLVATPPSITQPDASLPGATLNVFDVGTYDVTLSVTNGTDTDQTTITVDVQEVPVTANFTPHNGAAGTNANVTFNFPSNPSSADVTLTASTTGNPTSCSWQVNPSGPTFGSPTSCSSTTFTASTAQIGTTYTVTFTANNVTRQAVVNKGLIVQPAAGSNPTGADFTFGTPTIKWTVNGTPGGAQSIVMGGNTLTASASGLPTLNYSWSVANGSATGCAVTPAGPTTSNTASISATSVGTCDVTLTVTNGFNPPSSQMHTVTIAPLYTFAANVGPVFPNAFCTGCHVSPGTATQPDWTNDSGLYARISAAGVVGNGKLLSCPSAGCGTMGGGQAGFTNGDTSNYDIFLTWINSGAPNN